MAKRRRGGRAGARRAMEQEQRPHLEEQEQREHLEEQEQREHLEEQEQRGPHQKQRLYLILDDYPSGYSIREISLSPPSSRRQTRSSSSKKKNKTAAASGKGSAVRPLPEPIICLESLRGHPSYFSAVATRIVLTRHISPFGDGSVTDHLMPIVDVRHRGVTFGPGLVSQDIPIYVPVGAEVFVLDNSSHRKLSFQPPQLDARFYSNTVPWSWRMLQGPPFDRVDVTSYAVHPDGHTILFCTDFWDDNSDAAPAAFGFDTRALVWEKLGDWTLPFTGRAYFVHCLQAFVGLSKDPATSGHLASCDATTTRPAVWKLGKEKLFSEDPEETHVSATLVYMGGSGFCLVQCVAVEEHGNGRNAADDDKNLKEPRPSCCYLYRLTTFSLSYDNNGDLTTGNTSSVQCFEVPRETTEMFIRRSDPVAFWL